MCAVLIIHIYIIFLPLYIFEEIVFDLVFKCVDTVGRFKSDARLFHIFGPWQDRHFWPVLLLRKGTFSLSLGLRVIRLSAGWNISSALAGAVPLENFIIFTQIFCSTLCLVGSQFIDLNTVAPTCAVFFKLR